MPFCRTNSSTNDFAEQIIKLLTHIGIKIAGIIQWYIYDRIGMHKIWIH